MRTSGLPKKSAAACSPQVGEKLRKEVDLSQGAERLF
jgi:hypothetical protein